MRIYMICPVRNQTVEQQRDLPIYVAGQEALGHKVYYPPRNAPQQSATGVEIVTAEIDAIKEADEVHIFWDVTSSGSHFDLGAALALQKKIRLIHAYAPDVEGKSYLKVIQAYGGAV